MTKMTDVLKNFRLRIPIQRKIDLAQPGPLASLDLKALARFVKAANQDGLNGRAIKELIGQVDNDGQITFRFTYKDIDA